jgi:hypothetical protein
MSKSMSVRIDPKDMAEVQKSLSRLSGDEVKKAMSRGINRTLTGVRTDGTDILARRYALKKSDIMYSWKIRKGAFRDPHGVVSTTGVFLRLKLFGARQTKTGVSVKVLRQGSRKVIKHAYIGTAKKNQKFEQVYRRKWDIEWPASHKKPVNRKIAYAKLPLEYRFPVEALYGPRIQDYLARENIMTELRKKSGERLIKNIEHEVDYLMSQAK